MPLGVVDTSAKASSEILTSKRPRGVPNETGADVESVTSASAMDGGGGGGASDFGSVLISSTASIVSVVFAVFAAATRAAATGTSDAAVSATSASALVVPPFAFFVATCARRTLRVRFKLDVAEGDASIAAASAARGSQARTPVTAIAT